MKNTEAVAIIKAIGKHAIETHLTDPGDILDATVMAVKALVPKPDPITGLVPCGCGGRSFVWEGRMHSDTYYVQCLFCGVRTVDRVKKADAIREFNTAMGWKGGAE